MEDNTGRFMVTVEEKDVVLAKFRDSGIPYQVQTVFLFNLCFLMLTTFNDRNTIAQADRFPI